jgi:hypothetical protein
LPANPRIAGLRAVVKMPQDVVDEYGGGFIGMLRPELYERMSAAIPPGVVRFNQTVQHITQDEGAVRLSFADDLVFDHTPFLQKVIGDSNPAAINRQLALIKD